MISPLKFVWCHHSNVCDITIQMMYVICDIATQVCVIISPFKCVWYHQSNIFDITIQMCVIIPLKFVWYHQARVFDITTQGWVMSPPLRWHACEPVPTCLQNYETQIFTCLPGKLILSKILREKMHFQPREILPHVVTQWNLSPSITDIMLL